MRSEEIIKPFSLKTYRERRKRLAMALQKNSGDFLALLWSGDETPRNAGYNFPFRAQSDFLYLTGFSEPECFLGIEVKNGRYRDWLVLRDRDLSSGYGSELWDGERVGVARAPKLIGVQEAFDIRRWKSEVYERLKSHHTLYWRLGFFSELDAYFQSILPKLRQEKRASTGIESVKDPTFVLHEHRKLKSKEEILIMQKSAEIAARAHIRAMQFRPGVMEYQIQAEAEREFKKAGATTAYSPICATGNNACTLHYKSNLQSVKPGDLMLMDAGAELEGYASDITRCFPASGKFSDAQREVYTWVLKAQKAAIQKARVGNDFYAPHRAAIQTIARGLQKMGVIKKPVASIIKKRLFAPYFPHGTCHWLGMDVHDCGSYFDSRSKAQRLQPGHVITVEPGLYFREDDKTVPKKFRGIGVRIEDDVLITKSGPKILSESCPKEIDEIESLRKPSL